MLRAVEKPRPSGVKHSRTPDRCIKIAMAWSVQLLAAVVTLVVLAAISRLPARDDSRQAFIKALPGGGLRTGYFTWMKMLLRSITAMEEIVAEGYSQVCALAFPNSDEILF